jgi:hypothetical protein
MDDTQVAPSSVFQSLPYDDVLSYEELSTVEFAEQEPKSAPEPAQPSLADRIGNTKVYLVSDSIASRLGKVRGQLLIRTVR